MPLNCRPDFILASALPRRLALLADIGVVPDRVVAADIDETPRKGELPRDMAVRLAFEKGQAIAAQNPQAVVLAADTVVACGRLVLSKAESDQDVRYCLHRMSGRRHHVFTAVAVFMPGGRVVQKLSDSVVSFKKMTLPEIEAYVASGEGIGKAGGYAIQGQAARLIRSISGSYSGIVGLPLYETGQILTFIGM